MFLVHPVASHLNQNWNKDRGVHIENYLQNDINNNHFKVFRFVSFSSYIFEELFEMQIRYKLFLIHSPCKSVLSQLPDCKCGIFYISVFTASINPILDSNTELVYRTAVILSRI